MVSEAIARGDMGAINYFVAQQYMKALQAMASAPNQKVLIVPVETGAFIGIARRHRRNREVRVRGRAAPSRTASRCRPRARRGVAGQAMIRR